MRNTVLCFIVLATFGLAACGSSGSSSASGSAAPAAADAAPAPVDLSTVQGVSTPTSVQVVTANP